MKQIYRVPDMHCPACVMRLEGLEDELPGIRHIAASYRKQRLEVEYDEAQVTEAQIITAAEALGYALHPSS
ncbi:MAG: heavy-metal-associated domain-containing protein [Anaerolineae bacterium]